MRRPDACAPGLSLTYYFNCTLRTVTVRPTIFGKDVVWIEVVGGFSTVFGG
jgi:hypothetical protein